MALNNFKAFATGANANVTPQADYENLAALLTGFQSGKASSAQINKALRQASFVAAAVAQIIAGQGMDAKDDGNQAGFVTNLLAALAVSPALTGKPTTPDMDQGNYGQQIANSKFVRDAINVLIGGAPDNLNTLGELAQAMGNDPAFLTNVNNGLATLGNAITVNKNDVATRMSKAANGSDIADKTAFLANLGVLSAGLRSVGTGANQIPDMSFFTLDAGQTGGAKLPGGLMFQWGVTPSTTGTISASFKTPFPNACLWLGKNTYSSGSSATSTSVIEIVSPTKSGFTMSNIATLVNNNTAVAGPVNAGIAFFAIGW
ncbi:gp53-like domain-containing protein [Pantoea ananatis]|uniref:gp53-like domain-containing protein n=1 Tax=Pantoea ananas TaxID=553 RepID=UPI003C20BC14